MLPSGDASFVSRSSPLARCPQALLLPSNQTILAAEAITTAANNRGTFKLARRFACNGIGSPGAMAIFPASCDKRESEVVPSTRPILRATPFSGTLVFLLFIFFLQFLFLAAQVSNHLADPALDFLLVCRRWRPIGFRRSLMLHFEPQIIPLPRRCASEKFLPLLFNACLGVAIHGIKVQML